MSVPDRSIRNMTAARSALMVAAWAAVPLLCSPPSGAAEPVPAAAVQPPPKAAQPPVDPFGRADPIMLAGQRVAWVEASPGQKGALSVPGLGAPDRRWRLLGTSGQTASTQRLPAEGEALAFADAGRTAVVFFMKERTFGRQAKSNTKDSRKGWAIVRRNRPVEIETSRVEPWGGPLAFRYDYTLFRIQPKDGQRVCGTFHGRRTSGGAYAGSIGGYLCATPKAGLDRAELTRFVESIRVGPGLGGVISLLAGLLPGGADDEPQQVTAAAPPPAPSPPLEVAAAAAATRPAAGPIALVTVALQSPPAADDEFWDAPSDGSPIQDDPQPVLAVLSDDAVIDEACTAYLGDQAMHLRCQWVTGPDRALYVPEAGRNASLAVQMRCHPLREEPAHYAACVAKG
jgi:hypothetical protein